jgi:hypothetical protein
VKNIPKTNTNGSLLRQGANLKNMELFSVGNKVYIKFKLNNNGIYYAEMLNFNDKTVFKVLKKEYSLVDLIRKYNENHKVHKTKTFS